VFWDSQQYAFKERLNVMEIQMCLKWCGDGVNKLFSGGCDAMIHAYDVQKLKEIGPKEGFNVLKKETIKHTGPIMDLLPIPDMQILASCDLNSNINLWYIDDLRGKIDLDGHNLGVYSLDWYADNNMILSAGFDHDIYLWNPHVKKKIFTLKGHNHSMVGVKWLKGTN
jgi:WD40 repeat protein